MEGALTCHLRHSLLGVLRATPPSQKGSLDITIATATPHAASGEAEKSDLHLRNRVLNADERCRASCTQRSQERPK